MRDLSKPYTQRSAVSGAKTVQAVLKNDLQPWQESYCNILVALNESFDARVGSLIDSAHLQEADARLEARINSEYEDVIASLPEKDRTQAIIDAIDDSPISHFQANLTTSKALFSSKRFQDLPKTVQAPLLDMLESENNLIADAYHIVKLKALADLLEIQVLGRLLSYHGSVRIDGQKLTQEEAEAEYRARESVIAKALSDHMALANGISQQAAQQTVDRYVRNLSAECYHLVMHSSVGKSGRPEFESNVNLSNDSISRSWFNEAAETAAEPIKSLPAMVKNSALMQQWREHNPDASPNIQGVYDCVAHVFRTFKPVRLSEITMPPVLAFLHTQPSDALCKALEVNALLAVTMENLFEIVAQSADDINLNNDTEFLQAKRDLKQFLMTHGEVGEHVANILVNDAIAHFQKLSSISASHGNSVCH